MSTSISREEMLDRFDRLNGGVPNATEYQEFCGLHMHHPLSSEIASQDPFTDRYAELVMQLYVDLRGRADGYDPLRDEKSDFAGKPEVWTGVVPWTFKDTKLVSEFLTSWGQIMRCLDLEAGSEANVLEYGTGSGQLLTMLARLGLRAHAVDIDEGSLAQVRAASDAMGLDIQTERAVFGEGFADQTFDRIIFFEAFHHAFDFLPLLSRLQQRLSKGGRLIFCGEPIVSENTPSVPYPWGPRLDALSIFCIRRWGWMELGFSQPFFFEALQRKGWIADQRPSGDCARAHTVVARSIFDGPVQMGVPIDLGRHASGWHQGEGSHRWTTGREARFSLPEEPRIETARVRLYNPFPIDRVVTLMAGPYSHEVLVVAHTEMVDAFVTCCNASVLSISCEALQPSAVWSSTDHRRLGIAVREIEILLCPEDRSSQRAC